MEIFIFFLLSFFLIYFLIGSDGPPYAAVHFRINLLLIFIFRYSLLIHLFSHTILFKVTYSDLTTIWIVSFDGVMLRPAATRFV